MCHKICDMLPAEPLGFWGGVDMFESSCCHALAGMELPHFCIECGDRAITYKISPHHEGKPRPNSEGEFELIWNDDEDGLLFKCLTCNEEFFTAWTKPKWCARCGTKLKNQPNNIVVKGA